MCQYYYDNVCVCISLLCVCVLLLIVILLYYCGVIMVAGENSNNTMCNV